MKRDQQFRDQPSLLDPPLARANDPATSQESAKHIATRSATLRERMCESHGESHRTAREAAEWCVAKYGGEVESYRKRTHELVRLGRLVHVGSRKCRFTSRSASVYEVVK